MSLILVQAKSMFAQSLLQCLADLPESLFRFTKQQQVIGIMNITGDSQNFFDEVVNRIEEHIRETLTGQIPDRQSFRPSGI